MTFKPPSFFVTAGIFVVATVGTHLAQTVDRPITAVLIYLTGVIIIAVHSGMLAAIIGAVAASGIYNFFLSEPRFEFGVTTVDEAIPLIAFNATALLTGLLVGRLRDSVERARTAQTESAFLLTVSDRLQRALQVEDVEAAMRGLLPSQYIQSVKIFIADGDYYFRPSTGEIELCPMEPLLEDVGTNGKKGAIVLELVGARGPLGIVKFRTTEEYGSQSNLTDLQSVSALLALAIERCLLLEEVAETQLQARSEALKNSLFSSISHDLRTPITVMEAASGALSARDLDLSEEQRESLLSSIIEQCHRLDRYTTDLLDVGRIQAGLLPETQTMDLNEIAMSAIRQIRAAHPTLDVRREFSADPAIIAGNPTLIEQAIANLLDNASKFANEDPVTLSVKADDHFVELSITDRGSGIKTTDQERVFERFYKGKSEGTKAGSGLGLFIARGFVEACSGTLTVQSPVEGGRGTRFTMRFSPATDAVDERVEVSS